MDVTFAPMAGRSAVRTRQLWLTAIIVLLSLWIARPFLTPILWAVILAIAEWPLYSRAVNRAPLRPWLIALSFTLATALLVIIPLSLAAVSLAQENQRAIDWLRHAQHSGIAAPTWLAGIPLAGERTSAWWREHLASPQGANAILGNLSATSILAWTRSIGGEVAKESALFVVTLVALATLLIRGEQLNDRARVAAQRMFGEFGKGFLERMIGAVRATVNGTVLVSFVEGALIGIGYAVAGVPHPLLFATFTIGLALVPFGAWLAFGLASLILIGGGNAVAGGLLFAFGATVMTIGDNVVQPAVVGSAVRLPFLMAIIGAFGGLAALGLVGLFVGPVIMAALMLIAGQWMASSATASAPA